MKAENFTRVNECLTSAADSMSCGDVGLRQAVRLLIRAVSLLVLVLVGSACGGPSFTSAIDSSDGGTSKAASFATGGTLATGGSSAAGGNVSTGGSLPMSTGGSSAVPVTTSVDLDQCPCPGAPQCDPPQGKAQQCNQSSTKLGPVANLTCISSPTRCTNPAFSVYCFEC